MALKSTNVEKAGAHFLILAHVKEGGPATTALKHFVPKPAITMANALPLTPVLALGGVRLGVTTNEMAVNLCTRMMKESPN
mmetsp:Transcript_15781/g.28881  ORF Transcript_15781/g.28881 Transcript_15781/m.28881 type:complete len:81 (+) Transcript_15781:253-495(+)